MRRTLMLAVVVVVALTVVAASPVPAGAGDENTMIVARKTVQGTAAGGFTLQFSCTSGAQFSLNFDATGAPTTFSGVGDWMIVDGAWKLTDEAPNDPEQCTATETDADGAPTTSWTCEFQATTGTPNPPGGCDAPSGTGTGPVGFTLNSAGDEVIMQSATVHFTNTIPAPAAAAVPAAPTFTG